MGEEEVPDSFLSASLEAKLQELLHYITSTEIKLCADSTKEFVKLLRGSRGGELLRTYLRTSPKCLELLDAWKLRQGKPGISYVLSLISALLSHPDGRYGEGGEKMIAQCRALDNFARSVVDEKLEDVYKELNSKDAKRQKAALRLMASVVRRSSELASEVAKKFDFSLPSFRMLGNFRKKKKKKIDDKRKHSMRKPFVGFAMSFLEMGRPGLLRWILQQRDMYSGVLRLLGDDDDETLTFVLSTLRDRVLTEGSMVPPGLRSVLFGSVTLEQLISITEQEGGGLASELAQSILIMVCTHPSNGLMPHLKRSTNPLKGNPKRLLGLMKKLRAAEIGYHRDLLLAIVRGKPAFGSAYLQEFPYNIEDHASSNWSSVISLAADVVSAVGMDCPFGFLDSTSCDPPAFDGTDVQDVIGSVCPRSFTRSFMNKGLLHSDMFVKNATLRLLLEELRLLDSFICYMDLKSRNMRSWESLKREIQNEVRTLVPDPQVLLSLLSSLSSILKSDQFNVKRKADSDLSDSKVQGSCSGKKRKTSDLEVDADIIIGGIAYDTDISLADGNGQVTNSKEDFNEAQNLSSSYAEIWGSDFSLNPVSTTRDTEIDFYTKVFEALQIYLRAMPTMLEGSFEVFINLLSSSPELPMNLLSSVLSLLLEYVRWSPGGAIPLRIPPLMYKHLRIFINLSLFSPLSTIRTQAYHLSVTAMLSTGAFDRNPHEVDAWFLFLPNYNGNEVQGFKVLKEFSSVFISFLCDAISAVGNNLFTFWDIIKCNASKLQEFNDYALHFSPLAICVLQKCLRVIKSKSDSFSLPEKTMISFYVCSTLKYLLQTQVDASLLSAAVVSLMSNTIGNSLFEDDDSGDFLCEWRPLKSLLFFARSTLNCESYHYFVPDEDNIPADSSFSNTLSQTEELLRVSNAAEISAIFRAFCSSLLCGSPSLMLENFPLIMTLSKDLYGAYGLVLSPIFFVNESLLARLSKFWSVSFSADPERVVPKIICKGRKDEAAKKKDDSDGSESIAAIFSQFLEEMPFHVLFPALMCFNEHLLMESLGMELFFLGKLSESTVEQLVSYLHLVLFWVHQIQLSNCHIPSAQVNRLYESCIGFLKCILAKLSASKDFLRSPQLMQEVAECIFHHPAVTHFLSTSSLCSKTLTKQCTTDILEALSTLSKQSPQEINHAIVIVETVFCYSWSLINSQNSETEIDETSLQYFARAFNSLIQRLLLELRTGLESCIDMKKAVTFLPVYQALLALVPLASPFQVLALVCWIFNRINKVDVSISEEHRKLLLFISCHLTSCAYETVDNYLQQPITKRAQFDMFWKSGEQNCDSNIIREVYNELLKQTRLSEVDFADLPLLKAIGAVYRQKSVQHLNLHPLSFVFLRAVLDTPLEMISHCIDKVNVARARILFLIGELNPLHLSIFGHTLSNILHNEGNSSKEIQISLSSEDLLMLLPTSVSFLKSIVPRYGKQCYSRFGNIPQVYFMILYDGFSHWKTFASRNMLMEECADFLLSSMEEVLKFAECSFLGQAVHMVQYHFLLNGEALKLKKCLKLFNKMLPHSSSHNDLLDCDVRGLDSCSNEDLLTTVSRVSAKISLCSILLFPEIRICDEVAYDDLISARTRFIHLLVDSWKQIVKKFPSRNFTNSKAAKCLPLYHYLEVFILQNIEILTTKMHDDLIQLKSISFLEELIRSSLLYRFEDSKTLKTLRSILTSLRDGQFYSLPYLQLLLAHSQFPMTLHSISNTSENLQLGAFLKPMSSILRSLGIPFTNNENDRIPDHCIKKLEVVRLLRTLLNMKGCDHGFSFSKEGGVNAQELLMLLLSSYDATLSDIDLEIYSLMQEIEYSCGGSANFMETDFLWGSSSLRIRKERALEQEESAAVVSDAGAIGQLRRGQVRDNLPIDPKLCAATVLHFPYGRMVVNGPMPLNTFDTNETDNMPEINRLGTESIRRYDPVFLMRFSLHMLSVGFIEPVEFASLGLLAVAFCSLSSPDDGMRKLAYEALARFKKALEQCKKRKDVICLCILLNYVQNGIEEPWQRLPSVITLFVAEASFVLLDPSNEHYLALNKLLTGASKINLKCVPLFPNFLWSAAVNFKSERLWILRLIYGSLNADEDAPIFMRNSVFENLLSFYSSPVSDNESKELILQIIKKSVKLPKIARYLSERCGLFSWLSSVLSFITNGHARDDKDFYSRQLMTVLEVKTLSRLCLISLY
ncbi:hypothetical protein SAY86_004756 [Trapa natans]|uniref:Nucleolar pre-ribosomal-associated protein 1 n=1 Tax=Trapa natans TaxID=22666 RepID=A0AAN7MG37_TRANT|nr:hypothetical protein SAY86_004756 [Trapa natans]